MRLPRHLLAGIASLALACGTSPAPDAGDVLDARETLPPDAAPDTVDTTDIVDTSPPDAADVMDAPPGTWCSLGSDVPGAIVPAEFCVRPFAAPSRLGEPRVMAF